MAMLPNPKCPACSGEIEINPAHRAAQKRWLPIYAVLGIAAVAGFVGGPQLQQITLPIVLVGAGLMLYVTRTTKWFRCKGCEKTFTRSELKHKSEAAA